MRFEGAGTQVATADPIIAANAAATLEGLERANGARAR